MANDVVPALLLKIQTDFRNAIKQNRKIQSFLKKMETEKATSQEVSLYADRLGECASEAFIKNLTEENLPDGRLYWNIAERIIVPVMREVHQMVNDAAIKVNAYEDAKNGIGLAAQPAPFPEERIRGLLDKIVSLFDEFEDG